MKKYSITIKMMIWIAAICAVAASCKKFTDPDLVFEEYGADSSLNAKHRKVLIIAIDGVVGAEISALSPANITALQKQGKYTYSLWKDAVSRAGALASIINGTSSPKHLIKDSTFAGKADSPNPEDVVIPNFPSMFKYLLEKKPDIKTAVVTSWQPYAHYLRVADYHLSCNGDQAVKDSAVHLLSNVGTLGSVLVNFHDVDIAGNNGGYTVSNEKYKAAIQKIDGYVGELTAALKQRKNFDKEDWLIMVVSPYGGVGKTAKQGFLVVSNSKLSEKEVRKTGYSGVKFGWDEKKAEVKAQLSADRGLYNAGADKDFTVQITVKFDAGKSWPGFFGKTASGVSDGDVTGWVMIQSGNNIGVIFGGTGNGTSGKAQGGTGDIVVADGRWHTITMTVKTENNKRILRAYVDGETKNPNGTEMGDRNLSTSGPLTIGFTKVDGSGHAEFNALNAVYFNKALDQTTIKENLQVYDMTKHTAYGDITGYWPLDDGSGALMTNKANAGAGIDFELKGPYAWRSLNDILPSYYPPVDVNEQSIIAASYDVAAIMMYWLKIEVPPAWNLDGRAWLSYFDREIFPQE